MPSLQASQGTAADTQLLGEMNLIFECMSDAVIVADIDGRPVSHEFAGRMTGDEIAGWVTIGGEASRRTEWRATRSARGRMDMGAGEIAPARKPTLIAKEQT